MARPLRPRLETDEDMTCEGCGEAMRRETPPAETADELVKWKCPRCGSWCLTYDDQVQMAGWLLEGREWPR